jgi:hypothetical protein
MEKKSYIGQKKNFLTVIGEEHDKKGRLYLVCRCDCNNVKRMQYQHWKNGSIKSCGCMRLKLLHNATCKPDSIYKERLHTIWSHMKQRCYNPKSDNYYLYGGRGIRICDEWKNSYESFREWALSNGYADNLTIDRINPNGNYEPSNCRWATAEAQSSNRRDSSEWKTPKNAAFVQYNGEMVRMKDLCKEHGISVPTFKYRIEKMGLSVADALKKKLSD